jgi:hypothetical protein
LVNQGIAQGLKSRSEALRDVIDILDPDLDPGFWITRSVYQAT